MKTPDLNAHEPSFPTYSLENLSMEAVSESCIDYVCVCPLFVLDWLYKVTIWLDSMRPTIKNFDLNAKRDNFNTD